MNNYGYEIENINNKNSKETAEEKLDDKKNSNNFPPKN
jgi:hypothetical protein